MAKNNQNKNPKALNEVNYYETTGSVSVEPTEANAIINKSMDALSDNLLKRKVQGNKNTP
jgi:hypothetical protein